MQQKQKARQKELQSARYRLKADKRQLRKLPGGEQKRLKSNVLKRGRRAPIPATVQRTIPYREMYRDGVCNVREGMYSKTIQFEDINYQLAQADDKTQIFEAYCDFINYFDASVSFQLSFVSRRTNYDDYLRAIDIPPQGDGYDDIRDEFVTMLKSQLAKGNNGLSKCKYITFSIEAENLKAARPRLERVETDVLNNFRMMGVRARTLSGIERLEVLHGQLHPEEDEPFTFDWPMIVKSGLTTKDFICPMSLSFKESRTFRVSRTWGAVSVLQILAPELTDRMLVEFLDLDTAITVNLHVRSIDQAEAIKSIKRKITDLDKMRIEEQKKAVRSGYDMDVLPPDLVTYGAEAKTLLEDLQSRNERMFLVTVLILNTAPTKQKLEDDVFAAAGIAQKYNCALKRLEYQQEQGFTSSLPIGLNSIEIQRGLTTSSTAIFVPFTTEELFQDSPESLYYGLNALSNNIILADRKKLKNPNGLYLGVPGSGKSFAAKREIVNAFLTTKDDILIVDFEDEYVALTERLGGQVIRLSPTSTNFTNPLDINPDYDDENPINLKSDFILSLCELILGGKNGLEPIEKTIIDRCVRLVYRAFFNNPYTTDIPVLQDLYRLMRLQPEHEAQRLATALEIYVEGSLNVFNNRTNVDLSNRVTCFSIKALGKQLRKIAMLILQDQVWGRVTKNRNAHKATWYYCDEFHLLLKDEQTSAYSVEFWKRFRKWGGIPTGLTQNVKDLLASREVESIFENSDFICMLSQAPGDRQILSKLLGISQHQLSYVTHTNAGEGLLFYGNTIIPFVDRFPRDTQLYSFMTTKLDEVKAVNHAEETEETDAV